MSSLRLKPATSVWYYVHDSTQVGPCTLEELHTAAAEGKFREDQHVWREGYWNAPIQYRSIKRHNIEFDPPIYDFPAARSDSDVTILSGPNNCGKSFSLKSIYYSLGPEAYFVPCNRFYHIHQLQYSNFQPPIDLWKNHFVRFYTEDANAEQNPVNLQSILTALPDAKRHRLLSLCEEIIGGHFNVVFEDPNNLEFSHKYIANDGKSLAFSSTGTRLLITLFGICLHDEFEVLLIDEPELGLSPASQAIVVDYLLDKDRRRDQFPHLSHVFFATHSQLFLSRRKLTDNFVVRKDGDTVQLRQIRDVAEFHTLQFNMLGNRLDTMFFPECIIIVEGPSDQRFINRLLSIKFPGNRFAVVPSSGDPKRKVYDLRQLVGDLNTSPFGQRLFIVLDQVYQMGLVDELKKLGVPVDSFVVWEVSIEYVYPTDIMARVFCCDEHEVGEIAIEDDVVSFRGIERRKADLSEEICNSMSAESHFPKELEEKLVGRIRARIY